jgi:ABC-type dipeptide/oligopeptide/nickel transport systems, permease components
MWNKMLKDRNFMTGVFIIGVLLLFVIVGFLYLPYSPDATNIESIYAAPSFVHLFGTDNLGRDVFSRVMYAGRNAFATGFFTVAASLITGVAVGALAGFFGGIADIVLMRVMDAFKSIPGLLFALMIAAVFGKSFWHTILAISIIMIPSFARITRGSVMQIKSRDYVKRARMAGLPQIRILFMHVLPNVTSPIIIMMSMAFSEAVLIESSLSYLGLGIQPPAASWGQMLSQAQGCLLNAPWLSIFPGTMITLLVMGFNLLGDGMRDLLDVHGKLG